MKSWYADFKEMEQAYMSLKEQYMDLACAAGFQREGYFGDSVDTHEVIVKKIKVLAETANIICPGFIK